MSKFSRWFPTFHAAMKNIDANIENFNKEDGIIAINWSKFFLKYPAKRIVFLTLVSLLVFAKKIEWSHPFFESGSYPYTLDVEVFIPFLLSVICGVLAWSFWDEYQAKKSKINRTSSQ